MRAIVIYESMYGNTERVAKAIGEGLGRSADVAVVEVGVAPRMIGDDIDLLVIGGPTHQFGMSRSSSRVMAGKETSGDLVSRGIGIREWLDDVAVPVGENAAAAFDTTLESPRWIRYFGGAGRKASKRLRRLGFRVVAKPQSFWVTSTTGPLVDGEEDRAREWGEQLGAMIASETARHPVGFGSEAERS